MKWIATGILLTALSLVTTRPAVASDLLRAELADVLAYHRLHKTGCQLAKNTYSLYETQLRLTQQTQLAAVAGSFAKWASLELNDGDGVTEEASAAVLEKLRDQLRAFDAEHLQSTLDRAGEPNLESGFPAVSIRVEGKVPVDYQFIAPSIFRSVSRSRTQQLLERVQSQEDVESLLVRLWCERLLGQLDAAKTTTDQIVTVASAGQLTAEQKEEWQYLLASLSEERGQSETVASFLDSRLTKPPTSLWAHRALGLMHSQPELRLSILQNAASESAAGAHPFAQQVLTNLPKQTEAVLDRYWEIAWAFRRLDVDQGRGESASFSNSSAHNAFGLVSELLSPTVLEPWRSMSLLRLAVVLDTHAAIGDTETWQLNLTDELKVDHPILEPLLRLSRDHSGLKRTSTVDGGLPDLPESASATLVSLLWGGGRDVTVADTAPAMAGTSHRFQWIFLALLSVASLFAIGFFIRVIRRGER